MPATAGSRFRQGYQCAGVSGIITPATAGHTIRGHEQA